MLAVGGSPAPPLEGEGLLFEPKYDGIRAIVEVAGGQRPRGRLWSRNGNDKTAQFPDIVAALESWGRRLDGTVVFDGEVVALGRDGRPQGFERLQHRINVSVPGFRSSKAILPPDEQPAALIVFDLLRLNEHDLRGLPLVERRRALEALAAAHPFEDGTVRLSEQVTGSGRALYDRAVKEGWEGLLVKSARAPYRAGKRSAEWRKLKIQNVDDFIVCGYTAPRGTRARFGALILGRPIDPDDPSLGLDYVGDVGTGFSEAEIERLWRLLQPLARDASPVADTPASLARRARWVEPRLVAQVRYTEMTDEGRLRHPAYLGLRDDKTPGASPGARAGHAGAEAGVAGAVAGAKAPALRTRRTARRGPERRGFSPGVTSPERRGASRTERRGFSPGDTSTLIDQLSVLERTRKNGPIVLPDGDSLEVTNLHKVFWPAPRHTKGDLLRYYAWAAPVILPVVDNRPLVMKRLPNGVDGKSFYQHRAPKPVPPGVRVETLPDDDVPARLVGGSLKTLLYMAQLASISMDPWFSTMDALETPDQVAIDLDPQPGATFTQVLDVARWVRDVLARVNVRGYPKTSGSEGLHIFIPLPPGTPYSAGLLFCQIVATIVASQHPKAATVARMVGKRRQKTIYVDYLQNIQGKTLACAYSARASSFAGVSTPLTWTEVDGAPAPQDFTMADMPDRLAQVGDLWSALRADEGADLLAAIERLHRDG